MSVPKSGMLQKPAHPMPGWLALMEIPNVDEERRPAAEVTQVGPFLLQAVMGTQPGVAAGVVVEVGPLSERVEDALGVEMPAFGVGCTVYYHDDRGIRIGDYAYIQIPSVLAWSEAPE